MSNFLLTSLIASIVLTVLINVLPLVFPNAAAKAQRKIEENARQAIEQHEDQDQPRVKVFFPWKTMIVISLLLTIVVNIVGMFAGGR